MCRYTNLHRMPICAMVKTFLVDRHLQKEDITQTGKRNEFYTTIKNISYTKILMKQAKVHDYKLKTEGLIQTLYEAQVRQRP